MPKKTEPTTEPTTAPEAVDISRLANRKDWSTAPKKEREDSVPLSQRENFRYTKLVPWWVDSALVATKLSLSVQNGRLRVTQQSGETYRDELTGKQVPVPARQLRLPEDLEQRMLNETNAENALVLVSCFQISKQVNDVLDAFRASMAKTEEEN